MHIRKVKGGEIDAEKAFHKTQHPFMIKIYIKLWLEGNYLNVIKAMYEKSTLNNILIDKRLTPFPYDQE